MKKNLVAPHGIPDSSYRPSAETEKKVAELVGAYPRKIAATIPVLHAIQQESGYLTPSALAYAAAVTETSLTHVRSVVTFYTMFRVKPTGRLHLHVCTNTSCALNGSGRLMRHLEKKYAVRPGKMRDDGRLSVEEVECLASCGSGPCVWIGRHYYENMTPEKLDVLLETAAAGRALPAPPREVHIELSVERAVFKDIEHDIVPIDRYIERGGYAAMRKAFGMKREEVIAEVEASGLRGLGGALFPAGRKWKFLPKPDGGPVYLCCNADEGEPGTFKDREIMQNAPHRLIEGVLIASHAIGATIAYIYVRGELIYAISVLERALEEARAKGFIGKNILNSGRDIDVRVHPGAGAYVCGEETGLLESIEGKRGEPRVKPPFPAVKGLFERPTIINNVETLARVPGIIENGAAWFRRHGTEKSPGLRVFGVSGCVNRPGLFELPNGTPLRKVIHELAGGIRGGRKLKAVIVGGSSVPVIPAAMAETVTLDQETLLSATGTYAGSGGIIVIDDATCMVGFLARLTHFYAHESCGQCTPCREGTALARKILDRIENGSGRPEDIEMLRAVVSGMEGNTICALGDAAAWPIGSFLKHFESEFAEHIRLGRCPLPSAEGGA